MRHSAVLGIAVAIASLCHSSAQAAIVLTSGNSVVNINTASSAGVNGWTVDGVSQLAQQWYWFRTSAAGPELPINALGAPVEQNFGNVGTVSYSGGGYTIGVTFILTGGDPGTGVADLSEIISVHNSSGLAGFSLFQYADFDLGGDPANDSLSLVNANTVKQVDVNNGWTVEIADVPAPTRYQLGAFPSILNSLNDGAATNLTNASFAGVGDVEWAFQWNLNGGTDFIMSKTMHVQLVPEPGTMAMLLIGVAMVRRRRASQK